MKTGWKTTEFWATAGIQIVGVLGLFGVISVTDVAELNTRIPEIAVLVGDVVTKISLLGAMVVTVYRYITGRSAVKKAELTK